MSDITSGVGDLQDRESEHIYIFYMCYQGNIQLYQKKYCFFQTLPDCGHINCSSLIKMHPHQKCRGTGDESMAKRILKVCPVAQDKSMFCLHPAYVFVVVFTHLKKSTLRGEGVHSAVIFTPEEHN